MEIDLRGLRAELEASIAGASDEALQRAPAGKWNAAQILEHLYLTYKGTNRGIERCLDGGAPLVTHASWRHRLRQLVVIWLGYLPEGRKAPERTVPRGTAPGEVRDSVFGELEKMTEGLDACDRRFSARTKIMDHPALGPLTALEWRKFHLLHGRLHARQIRERTKL